MDVVFLCIFQDMINNLIVIFLDDTPVSINENTLFNLNFQTASYALGSTVCIKLKKKNALVENDKWPYGMLDPIETSLCNNINLMRK